MRYFLLIIKYIEKQQIPVYFTFRVQPFFIRALARSFLSHRPHLVKQNKKIANKHTGKKSKI